MAVFEVGDKVDLEDFGEALREIRSNVVFPVEKVLGVREARAKIITCRLNFKKRNPIGQSSN